MSKFQWLYNVLDRVCFVCLGKVSGEDISITIGPPPPSVGKTVKITCSSTVNPPADFILYHNETMITSIDGVGMDKVKEKSNINYTCKARTIFATAAKSDVVKVEGKIWVRTNLNIFVQKIDLCHMGKQFEKYKRLLFPLWDMRSIRASYCGEVQNHSLAHYDVSNRNVVAVSSLVAYHIF